MARDGQGLFGGTIDRTDRKDSPFAWIRNDEPQPIKHSVLLADDDASVRESLRKLLRAEGYQVILAVNGVEAVEKCCSAQSPIDLVLLDLNMPLKNGWAALDQLIEANPRLPVMVLTGLPNQYELAEAAGVSALVEKPINVQSLLQLMQELLAKPVQSRLPCIGRPVFPFHYLRVAGQEPQSLWPERHFSPYTSGGLNE